VQAGGAEREVGQFPDAPIAEAMAFYVRRYLDLKATIDLFATRLPQLSVREIDSTLSSISESLTEPAAVGDLEGLRARFAALKTVAAERREAVAAERTAAKEQALKERTAIVERAEAIAEQDPARTQWKNSGAELRELLESWKAAQRRGPRLDRPTEDGELLGADDTVLELPPDTAVTLAHGTLLPEAEVADWQEHLADYEVTPLFDQFSARAPKVDKGQWGIDDGAGRRVVARDLRKRAKARGYEPDSNIHWYSTFLKDFPVAGLCSVIDFGGVDVWSEDQVVTTGPLSLVSGRRAVPLEQVPPALLAECYADYRAIVDPSD